MSLVFGTKEWLDAFMNRLNDDPEFKRVGANYEGRIVFRCLAEPLVHEMLAQDLRFFVDPYHGGIRSWQLLAPGEEAQAEYEISGKYADWKLIAEGRLNLKKAVVMTRQLVIRGRVSELLRHMKAADRIVKVLSEMHGDFVFPDEMQQPAA